MLNLLKSVSLVVVFALVISPIAAQEGQWGHLKGRIKVEGELPAIPAEAVDKDPNVCMKDGWAPLDDNLVVNKEGYLRDAFVMMFLKPGSVPEVHPSYDEKKQQTLTLDNVNCRFQPHALFLRTGQTLTMKNSDDVGHNCHIITLKNEENVNLSQHGSVDVKLKLAEKVPGNVVCDIHKWMDAVILVRDEPYAAITDADGKFQIENIPAGTWSFQFWHKKGGYLADLQAGSMTVGRRGDIEITISDAKTLDLGELTIASKSLSK